MNARTLLALLILCVSPIAAAADEWVVHEYVGKWAISCKPNAPTECVAVQVQQPTDSPQMTVALIMTVFEEKPRLRVEFPLLHGFGPQGALIGRIWMGNRNWTRNRSLQVVYEVAQMCASGYCSVPLAIATSDLHGLAAAGHVLKFPMLDILPGFYRIFEFDMHDFTRAEIALRKARAGRD